MGARMRRESVAGVRRGSGGSRLPPLLALCLVALVPAGVRADVRAQGSAQSLEIRGSGSVLPLAQRVAEGYMTDHPDAIIVVSGGGDRHGLKSLILGTCEMAMAGTELPDDLGKVASDAKVELTATDVYQDAVVVVVHPKNPIRDLSMSQLRDVFRGAITNWSDVGGRDAPIVVATHEATSSTFEVFKRSVLGDDAVVTPKALITHHGELEKMVTENAIGFAGLHEADGLAALSVDGVVATPATIASRRYPIRRTLRLFQRKPESVIGRAVLDYFLAPGKGQAFVRAMGDVPVNP
jgi:phosphate transport system substrate-binding protein